MSQTNQAVQSGVVDTESNAVLALIRHTEPEITWVGNACSASLIAPNLVLTARHCIEDTTDEGGGCPSQSFESTESFPYYYVTTAADYADPDAIFYRVSHSFRSTGSEWCGNDIALLVLEESIPTSEAIPLIPELERHLVGGTQKEPDSGELISLIGYGMTCARPDFCDTADGLRRRRDDIRVSIVGLINAREWHNRFDGGGCPGDSGAPALDSTGRVVGILSRGSVLFGTICNTNYYTRIDSWRELIVQAALDAADFGGYEPATWARVPDPEVPEVPGQDAGVPSQTPETPEDDSDGGEGGCSVATAQDKGLVLFLVLLWFARPTTSRSKRNAETRSS